MSRIRLPGVAVVVRWLHSVFVRKEILMLTSSRIGSIAALVLGSALTISAQGSRGRVPLVRLNRERRFPSGPMR